MNKYYYIEDNEVKEIETIKDIEFIKKNKIKNAVATIEEIQTPIGYELVGTIFSKTSVKIIEDAISEKMASLSNTNEAVLEVIENVISALDENNTLKKDTLSVNDQEILSTRATLRAEIIALQEQL